MDIGTTVTLGKGLASLTTRLYEWTKGLSDKEAKAAIDEIIDQFRELKQQAFELEDQNRDLKEKLRFKQDEYDFKNPFWYDRKHPERALCPRCFSNLIAAPVGAPYDNGSGIFRKCLTCVAIIEEGQSRIPRSTYDSPGGDENSWMR